MPQGTVKTIREDKGFGFVAPQGGGGRDDLFFHCSAVENTTFELLQVGQEVTFDVEPDPRNPSRSRAVRVRVVGGDDQFSQY